MLSRRSSLKILLDANSALTHGTPIIIEELQKVGACCCCGQVEHQIVNPLFALKLGFMNDSSTQILHNKGHRCIFKHLEHYFKSSITRIWKNRHEIELLKMTHRNDMTQFAFTVKIYLP